MQTQSLMGGPPHRRLQAYKWLKDANAGVRGAGVAVRRGSGYAYSLGPSEPP